MDEMKKAAEKAVGECLQVQEGEQVLVITDKSREEIGQVLYRELLDYTEEHYLLKVPEQELGELRPPKIAEKMMEMAPDVMIIPTTNSYTHMEAREKACEQGSRVMTLPGITPEIFKRAVNIDYESLRREGDRLKRVLEKGEEVKVKTNSGTNIKLRIPNRAMSDLGRFNEPGSYGNLPTGEVFTAPDEKEVNGKIVIDSMQNIAKPKTEVLVQNGEAREIKGDKEFKERLWSYENGRNIAEFGIGLNPKATVTGNILEDEKVKGTCHIAFGKNKDFGGKIDAEIHWDAILFQPDVWIDKEKIMESGEINL